MNVLVCRTSTPSVMSTIGCIKKFRETNNGVDVEWEINDFLSLLKENCRYESPFFSCSSYVWNLDIFYESEQGIQLFLYKTESESKISVIFTFGIRLKEGSSEMRCMLMKIFDESTMGFGTKAFIELPDLKERQRELLPSGVFIITCSLVYQNIGPNLYLMTYQNLDALSLDLKDLYDSKKNSDVIISVREKEFSAHKTILTARSTVFAAMFEHETKEKKSGTIQIADCDPISFEDFLLYLYTGKAENLTTSNVYLLYRTADKYNVHGLKSLCSIFMKRSVSVENLFEVVYLAHQFNETELMSAAQDVFDENALKIVSGGDWEPFLKLNFSMANQLLIRMLQSQ